MKSQKSKIFGNLKPISSKGQITAFIIIGLVIVLTTALIIFLQERTTMFKPQEILPPELQPIKNNIENCLALVTEQGARIIGQNGGYLKIPTEIDRNPFGYISQAPFSKFKNPYWWNNGIENIPQLETMKTEMEQYIIKEIPRCFENLTIFAYKFNISEEGNLTPKVLLNENNILVELNFPLRIMDWTGEEITRISLFQADVPIRFRKTYRLAKQIMQKENEDAKIEKIAIDLLLWDPEIPDTEVEFSRTQKTWNMLDIRQRFQDILTTNLPLLRVQGTTYRPIAQDEDYIRNHYVWNIGNERFSNMHVSFSYDEKWQTDFDVSPRDGLLMKTKPMCGDGLMTFFCFQVYKFTYNINFPVMVTIKDDVENFVWNFPFRANINKNYADRKTNVYSEFNYISSPENKEYCDDRQHLIRIKTTNNKTDWYIDGVNLTFNCGKYRCDIGYSTFDEVGNIASLETSVPRCYNALIRAKAKDHLDGTAFVDTSKGNSEVEVGMQPTKDITKVTVKKHAADDYSIMNELRSDETAFVQLKVGNHKTTTIFPTEYNEGAFDIGGLTPTKATILELPLTLLAYGDYTYDVEIYVMRNDDLIGGWKGKWTVTQEMLDLGEEIEFHVIAENNPDAFEQLLITQVIEKADKAVPIMK